jgi:type VI secretion system protein ImpE
MTTSKELLDQGKLSAAIAQVTQDVKIRPADVPSRIFLFELLCFAGDLDRAEKQLDVIGHQSEEMKIGSIIYREVLAAERARRAVFAKDGTPDFLTAPPEYAALYLEALRTQRSGGGEKARVLIEKALAMTPALSGSVDGEAFDHFEDSDPFIGPFLELLVNEKYAWLPFEQIRRIEIQKPKQLRDLIWARAKLEARGGDLGEVFIPVLYPGSSDREDESIKLGRATDWIDAGGGLARGVGQRLFLASGVDRAVLEVTEISFAETGEATPKQTSAGAQAE